MNKDRVFEIPDCFRIRIHEEEPDVYGVPEVHKEALTFTISVLDTIVTSIRGTEIPASFNLLEKLPHGERITMKYGDYLFDGVLNYGYETDIIDEYERCSEWVKVCVMERNGVLIRYTKRVDKE